jgi:hypothetical protein
MSTAHHPQFRERGAKMPIAFEFFDGHPVLDVQDHFKPLPQEDTIADVVVAPAPAGECKLELTSGNLSAGQVDRVAGKRAIW